MNLNLSVTGCEAQHVNVHLTKKTSIPVQDTMKKGTFTATLKSLNLIVLTHCFHFILSFRLTYACQPD